MSEQPEEWYRIEYRIHVAGGQVHATWSDVRASSPEDALEYVKRHASARRGADFSDATVTRGR